MSDLIICERHLFSYHLLLDLRLRCLDAPMRLCDEKKDDEETHNVGEHHKENREVEKYQRFVSGVSHETLLLTNTWIEVRLLVLGQL